MRTFKAVTVLFLLLSLTMVSALGEGVLTVNGEELSREECNAWMWLVKHSYEDLVGYYQKTLGINYWGLTYSNGQCIWDSVKADAFKQLVMMEVFSGIAAQEGLMLDEEEERYCAQSALGAPSDRNFTAEDVEAILQKRLLAGKAYSYKLSYEQIDEDSIAASVDREAYTAYEVEYLYVPLYVYSANDALLEKCLAELQSLKEFEGDYADAVRLSAYLLAGNMTLCPADCESDMALLTAAKELSVGETSKPITTDYGLFMIRLLNDSDDSLYEAEVEKRLLNARKRAYRAEYNRLYAEAEYSLDPEYWDTLKP